MGQAAISGHWLESISAEATLAWRTTFKQTPNSAGNVGSPGKRQGAVRQVKVRRRSSSPVVERSTRITATSPVLKRRAGSPGEPLGQGCSLPRGHSDAMPSKGNGLPGIIDTKEPLSLEKFHSPESVAGRVRDVHQQPGSRDPRCTWRHTQSRGEALAEARPLRIRPSFDSAGQANAKAIPE